MFPNDPMIFFVYFMKEHNIQKFDTLHINKNTPYMFSNPHQNTDINFDTQFYLNIEDK